MPKKKCPNTECPFLNKLPKRAYTIDDTKTKKCTHCKTELVEVVETFEAFAAEVKKELGTKYSTSFQKKVIDFLSRAGGYEQRFRADFVDCMKRDTDRAEFLDFGKRKTTATTNCSDNAISAALEGDMPGDAPKGSKSDFEAAYLMSTVDGYEYLPLVVEQAEMFMGKFADFKAKLEPQCRYVAMFRASKTDKIGHMLYFYTGDAFVNNKKSITIYDPQKLQMSYLNTNGVWEVWKRAGAETRDLHPCCEINLEKTKIDYAWV